MLDRARVGTRQDDRTGGLAALLRHHFLHSAHQQVCREHPAQTGGCLLYTSTIPASLVEFAIVRHIYNKFKIDNGVV